MGFMNILDPGGLYEGLSGNVAADAASLASRQTQDNINRGLSEQAGFQRQAQNQLQGGIAGNLGFLNQAQGMFGNAASLANPALSNLQSTSTADGRALTLQQILNDPNLAASFGDVNRQTGNQLSGQSARRSGYGENLAQMNKLGFANQILGQQDENQQSLANVGLGAQSNIASLLGQQGAVAGQGGLNLSNLTQQGSANRMNLLGQLGQAGAAGTVGAANAKAQGAQNTAGLGLGILSLFSDERLKENIKRVGATDSGLSVYTYNYKGDSTPQMGVMAQEALDKFPDAVSTHESGYMMVNYGGIS